MNLSDVTASKYLNSEDYPVGTKFPPLEIERVTTEKAPSGGADNPKRVVLWLKGVTKGLMVSSRKELRQIAGKLGAFANLEQTWTGNFIGETIVDGVRRPTGTVGTAFRAWGVWKKGTQPTAEPGAPDMNKPAANGEKKGGE